MTTNCIIEPRQSYKDRIFTTGEVGWSGVSHIDGKIGQTKDYSAVINKALVSRLVGRCGSGSQRGKVEAGMATVDCVAQAQTLAPPPALASHSPALSSPAPPPAPPPQELPGFTEEPPESEAKFVTTGFARNAVLVSAGLLQWALAGMRTHKRSSWVAPLL